MTLFTVRSSSSRITWLSFTEITAGNSLIVANRALPMTNGQCTLPSTSFTRKYAAAEQRCPKASENKWSWISWKHRSTVTSFNLPRSSNHPIQCTFSFFSIGSSHPIFFLLNIWSIIFAFMIWGAIKPSGSNKEYATDTKLRLGSAPTGVTTLSWWGSLRVSVTPRAMSTGVLHSW